MENVAQLTRLPDVTTAHRSAITTVRVANTRFFNVRWASGYLLVSVIHGRDRDGGGCTSGPREAADWPTRVDAAGPWTKA